MSIPILDLVGDAYAIGYQHGSMLRERIQAFSRDGLFRINRILYEPTSLRELSATIREYEAEIGLSAPPLIEEISGLAAGAGISYEEAILLQIRREVIGYRKVRSGGDCTAFARNDGDECVIGQTVDLNGDLDEHVSVLRCRRGSGGRKVLILTFSGLLGYLGMNSDGLAIGLNLVLGGTWKPGLPPYLAIRHLLERASCIEDCMDLLAHIRLASSRSLVLCDRTSAANVEWLDGVAKWTFGEEMIHTNHFLADEFSQRDEINAFAKNSSVRRLKACQDELKKKPGRRAAESYFDVLAVHPICVHKDGNIRRESTVAAVVMKPREGSMYIRVGPPCLSQTRQVLI
jgi:predicted choloylglycine hydrolase